MYDATIGILTYKSRDMLEGCLNSILSHHWSRRYEIIVVDNCSQDGTTEMVEQKYPAVWLIKNSSNKGVAPARNQIIKEASGNFIIFLDVDTLVHPESLDTLIQVMESHLETAIGGPKLVYRDGKIQLSCRPFPSLLNIIIEGTFLRDWFPNSKFVKNYTMEDWPHDKMREVDWMYGAALIIRRGALEKIGLFDESFFYLYEDIDICFRAKKAGYKIYYIPQATVTHFLERERKGIFHKKIHYHIRSILIYLFKDYYRYSFQN